MPGWIDDYLITTAPEQQGYLGGEDVVLWRSSQIEPLTAGVDPSALELAADASAGATALELRLAGGARANGYLCQGEQLLLGGHRYTVGAVVKLTGAVSLHAVPVAPALVAGFSAGTAVALQGASYPFSASLFWRDMARDDKGELLAWEKSARMSLPKLGAPTVPRQGDLLVRADGTSLRLDSLLLEDASVWWFALGLPNA